MQSKRKLNIPATILSLAIASLTTGHANADGYAQDSAGTTVKSGFGECVQTGYWDNSMNTPECDATLAARLEEERLAAERLAAAEQAALDAAARAAAIQPAAAHVITMSDEKDVTFAFDSAQLTAGAINELERIADVLSGYSKIESVNISGFTDSIGSDSYNATLSERRAQEVKKVLSSKGIPLEGVQVQGFGESQPVASNTTSEGRAKNRRVEIRIVGQGAQ